MAKTTHFNVSQNIHQNGYSSKNKLLFKHDSSSIPKKQLGQLKLNHLSIYLGWEMTTPQIGYFTEEQKGWWFKCSKFEIVFLVVHITPCIFLV